VGRASIPAVAWIVHYDDGTSFTSTDGDPWEAPRDGVQVVQVAHEYTGRLIWHSFDYYCWQEGEWVPRGLIGLHDYLRQPGADKIVLQGRAVAYRRFRAVYDQAVADERLPFKSARDQREPDEPTR
jgi:hypothetical protein